ncbi:ribosomal rna methyltransferase [Holotrichia oblita]|uniref:Ribosomal rna methyltransferase n=1 Tax=Holotrichia oblita TaxID=644536 RepID=A0ACB9TIB1_HOLOL|nr:ribosomal rna methyltransferase [Holotrichia oblita]
MKPERDIYFQKALEEGYLARSAYKLLQIDEIFNIFEGVTKAIDLCSAPGSWTQVIYNKLHKVLNNFDPSRLNPNVKIVSVDMMPMDHFPGVIHLQADISQYSTMKEILEQFNNEKVDIVVCDGAIDVVGMQMVDYYMHHRIFLAALYITLNSLRLGGSFIMKIFINKGHEKMVRKLELFFDRVTIVKPSCSRNKEAFAVCQDFIPLSGFDPVQLTPFVELQNQDFSNLEGIHRKLIPYLCGDCYEHEIGVKTSAKIRSNDDENCLFKMLNIILKDKRDDIKVLKERLSKDIPVYQITKDNRLDFDNDTAKIYFEGFKASSDEEITDIKLCDEIRTGENNIDDDQDLKKIIEKLHVQCISSNYKRSDNIPDDDPKKCTTVNCPETEKCRSEISDVLNSKIKRLELENKGKFCGLGFNLDDWRFFTCTNDGDLNSIQNDDLKKIDEDFKRMYDVIKNSEGVKCRNVKELFDKQEELKQKVREYVFNDEIV